MANIVIKDKMGNNQIYKGITTITLQTEDGNVVDFVEGPKEYVSGNYVEQTLLLSNWNGTSYTLTLNNISSLVAENVQLGIPPTSSLSNACALIESGLTIAKIETSSSTATFIINAFKAPRIDLNIAIWGI